MKHLPHTVLLDIEVTWLNITEYRVWLNENTPGWEYRQHKLNPDAYCYSVNFQRAEDATAFKLKFLL
jgi:hypothetical protein